MRLKTINWSPSAGAYYLRLLSAQRRAIDVLVGGLREAELPGPGWRQLDEYPDYWFAKTESDLLMVIRRGVDAYSVATFADWNAQYALAIEEAAAAALAEAEPEPLKAAA